MDTRGGLGWLSIHVKNMNAHTYSLPCPIATLLYLYLAVLLLLWPGIGSLSNIHNSGRGIACILAHLLLSVVHVLWVVAVWRLSECASKPLKPKILQKMPFPHCFGRLFGRKGLKYVSCVLESDQFPNFGRLLCLFCMKCQAKQSALSFVDYTPKKEKQNTVLKIQITERNTQESH